MLNYRRNMGSLPQNTIAGLLRDITTDATQFLYTFPLAEDWKANPQRNMPASQLSVRRSLLSANTHISSIDTPKGWLKNSPPQLPPGGGVNTLGHTHQQQYDEDRRGGGRDTSGGNDN